MPYCTVVRILTVRHLFITVVSFIGFVLGVGDTTGAQGECNGFKRRLAASREKANTDDEQNVGG